MKLDDLHDQEERVTDGSTGGQKGKKLTQLGALDPIALIYLARVAGMGANKYAPHNYLKGYNWSLTHDAGQRHALLFWSGEDIDPESGLPHPAHEAWHALAKLSFYLRGIGTDDRPPALEEQYPPFDLVAPPLEPGQQTQWQESLESLATGFEPKDDFE